MTVTGREERPEREASSSMESRGDRRIPSIAFALNTGRPWVIS
jgi:hypothetical protein